MGMMMSLSSLDQCPFDFDVEGFGTKARFLRWRAEAGHFLVVMISSPMCFGVDGFRARIQNWLHHTKPSARILETCSRRRLSEAWQASSLTGRNVWLPAAYQNIQVYSFVLLSYRQTTLARLNTIGNHLIYASRRGNKPRTFPTYTAQLWITGGWFECSCNFSYQQWSLALDLGSC